MEKVIKRLFEVFDSVFRFIAPPNRGGKGGGRIIIIVAIAIMGISHVVTQDSVELNRQWNQISFGLVGFSTFSCIFVFLFELDSKIIIYCTKGKCTTPRELFRQMTHFSYFYGLTVFCTTAYACYCSLVSSVHTMITGHPVYYRWGANVWIGLVFLFSFIYFCYHLYLGNITLNAISKRVQFYSALWTMANFILLWIGIDEYFEVIISGLLMTYVWLEYLIYLEENKK